VVGCATRTSSQPARSMRHSESNLVDHEIVNLSFSTHHRFQRSDNHVFERGHAGSVSRRGRCYDCNRSARGLFVPGPARKAAINGKAQEISPILARRAQPSAPVSLGPISPQPMSRHAMTGPHSTTRRSASRTGLGAPVDGRRLSISKEISGVNIADAGGIRELTGIRRRVAIMTYAVAA